MLIKKINDKLRKNIMSIIACIVIIQPLIDVLIGVSIKMGIFYNIVSPIRLVILMFFLYYLFFVSKNDFKKRAIILISIIASYLLLFFINNGLSFTELKTSLRVFYLPIMFVIFYTILKEQKKSINSKYYLVALLIYACVIIFGAITNTAFNSYLETKVGTSGYFNAANEIGGIVAILLPFVFNYVFHCINYKKILYFFIILIAIVILGTKTPFISLVICTVYYIGRTINKKNMLRAILISSGVILILGLVFVRTPAYKNIKIHLRHLEIDTVMDFIERPELFDHFMFGSRLRMLGINNEIYNKSPINNIMLGMGYTKNVKLVEMDFYDIFHRQGLVGFVIYMGSILYIVLGNIKNINKNHILAIVLIVLVAYMVGHVLTAPAVSTFVMFVLCGFIFKKEVKHEG